MNVQQKENASGIRVRPIHNHEYHDASRLIHHSVRVLNSKDHTSQQLEAIYRMYSPSSLRKWGTVLIAEHHSQIVGVAKVSGAFLGSQWIEAVFTHPDYVRTGIGKALIHEIERRAAIKKVKKISVISSITAVDFYNALKYEQRSDGELGSGIHELGSGIHVVFMDKQLSPFTLIERLAGITLGILALLFVVALIISFFYVIVF